MTPHLVKWHERYADDGLVIIDIDNGLKDPLGAVRDHVRSERLPFAVLHDSSGAATRLYGVRGYPSGYLIDRSGEVIWEGVPIADPAGAEERVREAIAG